MNAGVRFLFALVLLAATPSFAAKPAAKPAMPSAQLSHLIDTTMAKMSDITNSKQTFNRTPLTTAAAEFTASAQTAPPEKQPMYKAVLNVMAILLGTVDEHTKAVADLENSRSVHGPPDTKDLEISNPQHHWDAAAVARANKAKENHVNGDAEKAALEKDQFFSKGALAAWTKRFGQLRDTVEQAYSAEVLAEKQLAMLTPATPPPLPKPAVKPESKPALKEATASDPNSPVGAWKAVNPAYRSVTLKEDNTIVSRAWTGTWKWTDQSKRALAINWSDGIISNVILSPDGRTMKGKATNGHDANLTRATEPAPAAPTAPPPAVSQSTSQPKEPSVSGQNSPVGTWKAAKPYFRSAILKEDNTVTGGNWADTWKWTGTWKWTDQSKGALTIDWKDGMKSDLIFSTDGRIMTGKNSNGHAASFTRSTSPPGT